jgi:flagellar biosynthetic protein FliR
VDLQVDMQVLTVVLLVGARLSALFLLTPLFAAAQIPAQFRTLFLLALAFTMVMALGIEGIDPPTTLGGLIQAMSYELVLGGLLAFGLFASFGAFLFGGRILDFQMGFGVANLIDPATNTQSPLVGSALNLMAVTTFFLLNGHHMMIRGLAYSLERIPPGTPLPEINLAALVAQFGVMFVYGFALVAPAVITLLLLDAGMAFAARTMPQMNMFILSLPLKILVGLSVLAASLSYMEPLLQRIYESIFRYWERILG